MAVCATLEIKQCQDVTGLCNIDLAEHVDGGNKRRNIADY